MGAPQIATVTGASGYIATEIVHQLLQKGYTVRGTVRDPSAESKVGYLHKLGEPFPGKLKLYAGDLLTEGSFDEAVRGADVVFHVASPYKIDVKDNMKEIVEPAVKGAQNVLSSVAKSKDTVRRVVFTSSVFAVVDYSTGAKPKNGQLFTEEDWNELSKTDGDAFGAYAYSKAVAEKAAWEWSKKEGVELVTILPGAVCGPPIGAHASSESVNFVKEWFQGKPMTLDLAWADVRDVARAHILAEEVPSASGRYLVTLQDREPVAKIGRILQEAFPQCGIPLGEEGKPIPTFDGSRVQRDLGLCYTPLEESFVDMARALLALGLVKPKPKAK